MGQSDPGLHCLLRTIIVSREGFVILHFCLQKTERLLLQIQKSKFNKNALRML